MNNTEEEAPDIVASALVWRMHAFTKADKRFVPTAKIPPHYDMPVLGGQTKRLPNDQFCNCPVFQAMSAVEKGTRIEQDNGYSNGATSSRTAG